MTISNGNPVDKFSQAMRIESLKDALRTIAQSDDEGGQDQIAPDMWEFCRERAQEALDRDERIYNA